MKIVFGIWAWPPRRGIAAILLSLSFFCTFTPSPVWAEEKSKFANALAALKKGDSFNGLRLLKEAAENDDPRASFEFGKLYGAVLAKRDAWARIAGCMREEAGSVVGSVIV